jgi:hypothetical protein
MRPRFFCARFAALRPVELKAARREQLRASLRRKEERQCDLWHDFAAFASLRSAQAKR